MRCGVEFAPFLLFFSFYTEVKQMSSSRRILTVRFPNDTVPNYEKLYVGGVDIYQLIANTVGTNNGSSATITVSVGESLFITIAAGAGYAAGEIVRRVEVTNTSTGSTSVGWYNVSRSLPIATEPTGLNLRLPGESALTKAQLEALVLKTSEAADSATSTALGKTSDSPMAADGTGSGSVIAALKRIVSAVKTLADKFGDLGQKNRAGSSPVVLASEQETLITSQTTKIELLVAAVEKLQKQLPAVLSGTAADQSLAVTIKNPGDISSGSGGTTTSAAQKPTDVIKYIATADVGTDLTKGDLIYKITTFDTSAATAVATVAWYNVTKKRGLSTVDETKLQEQTKKEITPDVVISYDVIKISDLSVLTIGSIESTVAGKILAVDIYQESGVGQIVGANDVSWDLPAGAAYTLGQTRGVGAAVIDPVIRLRSTAGSTMRVGVHYRKNNTVVTTGTHSYTVNNKALLVDNSGAAVSI